MTIDNYAVKKPERWSLNKRFVEETGYDKSGLRERTRIANSTIETAAGLLTQLENKNNNPSTYRDLDSLMKFMYERALTDFRTAAYCINSDDYLERYEADGIPPVQEHDWERVKTYYDKWISRNAKNYN